jgi:hypothetical protein
LAFGLFNRWHDPASPVRRWSIQNLGDSVGMASDAALIWLMQRTCDRSHRRLPNQAFIPGLLGDAERACRGCR